MLGDCIRVSSSYAGDFSVIYRLANVQHLVLFAAGTGFTPMAALIAYCYAKANNSMRFVAFADFLLSNAYFMLTVVIFFIVA